MGTLDLTSPFAREAWAEVDAIDVAVGLDPAMFPFPEPDPVDRFAGNPHVRTSYVTDCRCQVCYASIHQARQHYNECRDCGEVYRRYEKEYA